VVGGVKLNTHLHPVPRLTLNLLTTSTVTPPSNASKWQRGFNLAFKGLRNSGAIPLLLLYALMVGVEKTLPLLRVFCWKYYRQNKSKDQIGTSNFILLGGGGLTR
jgi:hypothetical protein